MELHKTLAMTVKKTALWGGLTALLVIGIVLSLMFILSNNTNHVQDHLLTAEQAKAEGMVQAGIAGLVGEPTSASTRLMNLEAYVHTSSKGTGQLGADAATVGLHPDKQVWVVSFRGHVKMTLPSAGGKTYDNITFALDARTGEVIGVRAYVDGYSNPFVAETSVSPTPTSAPLPPPTPTLEERAVQTPTDFGYNTRVVDGDIHVWHAPHCPPVPLATFVASIILTHLVSPYSYLHLKRDGTVTGSNYRTEEARNASPRYWKTAP